MPCWDQPAASRTDNRNFGIAGDSNAGHFGGRIGMRQAAADRAAFADRAMRNMSDGSGKQRMRSRKIGVRFDVAPTHPCAKVDASIVDLNRVETSYAPDID